MSLSCGEALAQTLDKIYTFAGKNQSSGGIGYNFVDAFYDAPLVIGTGASATLWFTSQKGGLDDEGELIKFSLATNTLTVLNQSYGGASETPVGSGNFLNDPAGSEASPVYDNGDGTQNYLYFTTVSGGVTGAGTLVRYNIDTNTSEILWSAPAASVTGGRQPRGTVAIVDRGVDGKDIYFTASGGGATPGTSSGAIVRYNTLTGNSSVVIDFDGNATLSDPTNPTIPSAGMPYDGFVRVGNKLYFTTFAGGTGPATGSGTLGYIDISNPANPIYQLVASLPGSATSGAGSDTRLAGSTPIYDATTNALYFTTVGSNGNPGDIMKFTLDGGVLSTLYALAPGANTGPNAEGRLAGYNSPFLYDGYLYYVTRNGGANNLGVVSRYNLALGTNEVLYNLTADNGGGYGDFAFSDFDFNNDGNPDPALYFLSTGTSTTDGVGAIMRLSVPEPGSSLLCLVGAAFVFSSRRRKDS